MSGHPNPDLRAQRRQALVRSIRGDDLTVILLNRGIVVSGGIQDKHRTVLREWERCANELRRWSECTIAGIDFT